MAQSTISPWKRHITDNGKSGVVTLEQTTTQKIRIPGVILAVITLLVSVIGGVALYAGLNSPGSGSTSSVFPADNGPASESADNYLPTDADGCVFPDSSTRDLTDAEIADVAATACFTREQILQFAINEIYARNHYSFQLRFWQDYYASCAWYSDEGLNMEEACALFNCYEAANVHKLVLAQNRNGR